MEADQLDHKMIVTFKKRSILNNDNIFGYVCVREQIKPSKRYIFKTHQEFPEPSESWRWQLLSPHPGLLQSLCSPAQVVEAANKPAATKNIYENIVSNNGDNNVKNAAQMQHKPERCGHPGCSKPTGSSVFFSPHHPQSLMR